MQYTDNPIADYDRYLGEEQTRLDRLPRCCECDEPITDEQCYEINGDVYCERCMDGHRKWVEDIG